MLDTLSIAVLIASLLDPRSPVVVVGKGCGVIVDTRGYVLTCEHVVKWDYDGRIELYDGSKYDAKQVSTKNGGELLLLRIFGGRAKRLVPVRFAESLPVVGAPITCVGHPDGYTWTVSKGWLSAVNRDIPYPGTRLKGLLQLQAGINPGHSGGPVFDAHGRMVGLTVAKREGLEGIGFAIPLGQIKQFLKDNLP